MSSNYNYNYRDVDGYVQCDPDNEDPGDYFRLYLNLEKQDHAYVKQRIREEAGYSDTCKITIRYIWQQRGHLNLKTCPSCHCDQCGEVWDVLGTDGIDIKAGGWVANFFRYNMRYFNDSHQEEEGGNASCIGNLNCESNWWQDSGCTIPANSVPNYASYVVINGGSTIKDGSISCAKIYCAGDVEEVRHPDDRVYMRASLTNRFEYGANDARYIFNRDIIEYSCETILESGCSSVPASESCNSCCKIKVPDSRTSVGVEYAGFGISEPIAASAYSPATGPCGGQAIRFSEPADMATITWGFNIRRPSICKNCVLDLWARIHIPYAPPCDENGNCGPDYTVNNYYFKTGIQTGSFFGTHQLRMQEGFALPFPIWVGRAGSLMDGPLYYGFGQDGSSPPIYKICRA